MLRGSHADVNPKAMGIGLEALFLIELSKHDRGAVDRFMTEVVDIPEVRSILLITGRYDFVVHVVARDMHHLKRFGARQLHQPTRGDPHRDIHHLRGPSNTRTAPTAGVAPVARAERPKRVIAGGRSKFAVAQRPCGEQKRPRRHSSGTLVFHQPGDPALTKVRAGSRAAVVASR